MPRARATNLDPHPVRFVGRAADLAAVARLLEAERLVTVLGPPGTGKTRLARELGERQLPAYAAAGGVWFCDLTEATDADGICASVSRALAVALTTAGTTRDTVTRIGHLLDARGALLLILDNFEQIVVHAPATVGVWLRMAPEAKFLVASRQRLGLPGEALYDLAPLSVPTAATDGSPPSVEALGASEAVQLFVERARTVRHDYALREQDTAAVADLVRHLDGLPLAIELAAARMRLLSPAQILQHLPRRFKLLGGARKPAGQRQATLWGAIEWSWNLLDPFEQSALAQCSVFRGGFALDAAEAVIDLSGVASETAAPWILDVLQSLRDKSLLFSQSADASPGTESRFALYVSIRAYAAEKLEELGLEPETMARHAAHFLRIGHAACDRLDSAEGIEAYRLLGAEGENLLAVFRRAVENSAATGSFRVGSLGPVLPPERATQALQAALVLAAWLSGQGPFGLCLSILDTALAGATPARGRVEDGSAPPELLVRALEVRGTVKRLVGRTAEGLADVEAARAIAERIGRGPVLAGALQSLGWPRLMDGRPAEARDHYEQALAMFREAQAATSRDPAAARRAEGRCLAGIGDTFYWFEDARPFFEQALAIHREVGDLRFMGFTTCKLGAIETHAAHHTLGRQHLDEALRISTASGDRRCEAVTLGCMAILEHDLGRAAAARELYDRALALHREIDNRWFEGIYLGYLGNLHFEEGRLDEARAIYEEAVRIDREVGWSPYEGLILASLGALLALSSNGEPDLRVAAATFERAEERIHGLGRPELSAVVAILRGYLDLHGGDAGEAAARRRLAEGEAFARRSVDARFALRCLGRVLATRQAGALTAPPSVHRFVPPPAASASLAEALVVAESGRWFQPPRAERVSLQRRRAMHHIVKALADLRQETPGTALTVEGLLEKGWPGERVHPEAGADRVYMALSTLRKLGLREVLLSRDDGYLFDPRVRLVRAPE